MQRGRGREVGAAQRAPRFRGRGFSTRAREQENGRGSPLGSASPSLALSLSLARSLARSGERRGLCHVTRVRARDDLSADAVEVAAAAAQANRSDAARETRSRVDRDFFSPCATVHSTGAVTFYLLRTFEASKFNFDLSKFKMPSMFENTFILIFPLIFSMGLFY